MFFKYMGNDNFKQNGGMKEAEEKRGGRKKKREGEKGRETDNVTNGEC